jgi:hypothetical protein
MSSVPSPAVVARIIFAEVVHYVFSTSIRRHSVVPAYVRKVNHGSSLGVLWVCIIAEIATLGPVDLNFE